MTETTGRANLESNVIRVVDRVEQAVYRGVDAAEKIHRRVAAIPLDIVAPIDEVEAAVNDLRRIQNRSLDVVYGVARDVNHEIVGLARAWMGGFGEPTKPTRKRTTKNVTKKKTPAKGRATVRAA
jgi:hypothetical protein